MEIKPTDSELEILQVLWKKGACTVRDVNEALSAEKKTDVGYTTTLKMMQIMHEKGMVERNAEQRTHIYKSLLTQERTRGNIVDKMISTVFNGSASQLVMQALSSRRSSKKEISEIREYLDKLYKNK